jgi:NADPH-dependent glutamate synthase beta subunit-like oxidoreductase
MPVADIQRYLAVQANKNGWSKLRLPKKSSGKKVAVIGSGPGGLSCAAKLVEAGHSVTIFDKNKELGGMVRYVIGSSKQGDSLKNETEAIFSDVPGDCLKLQLGRGLDADFNLDKVMAQGFDSAFIAMGLWESKTLHSADKIEGLWGALEFLAAVKQGREVDIAGRRVAVIGGGNTGIDVANTAKKKGAASVYMICFESFTTMPAWLKERQFALTEDISFMNLFMPKKYVAQDGRVKSVKMTHVNLAEPDENGFCAPIEIDGADLEVEVDVIIEALGQKAPDNLKEILPGVELTGRGLVAVKPDSLATSRKGVFAGGDIINGGLTVVRAVADGVKAAKEIDKFLVQ